MSRPDDYYSQNEILMVSAMLLSGRKGTKQLATIPISQDEITESINAAERLVAEVTKRAKYHEEKAKAKEQP
jgi:hypothetical protein